MPSRLRAMPAPLAVLLALVALETAAWALLLPPLQGPDETAHVAYVQDVVERGEVPFHPRSFGGAHDLCGGASSELRTAAVWAQLEELRGNLAARPAWTAADVRLWRAHDAALGPGSRADGGFSPSMRNPPLYYLYDAVPYAAARDGSIFTRMTLMRLWNVPVAVALVALAWLLAGELLGAGLLPRTLAAGLVALQPALANVAGVVDPDLLLVALWTAALLVMARLVRRGASGPRVAALVAVVAGACLTHGRGLSLLAPAVATLGVLGARRWRVERRTALAAAGAAAAAAVAGGVAYAVQPAPFHHSSVGGLLSYLATFYLPGATSIGPPSYGVREVFVARWWGAFAQLEVHLPGWAVDVLSAVALAALAGVVAALWRARRRLDPALVGVMAVAGAAYLAQLHLVAYHSMVRFPSDPVVTGRYLLPLCALAACAVAFAVCRLPRRVAVGAAGAGLAGVVVLQLDGLFLVAERFYS